MCHIMYFFGACRKTGTVTMPIRHWEGDHFEVAVKCVHTMLYHHAIFYRQTPLFEIR